jgi:hypothetical protein
MIAPPLPRRPVFSWTDIPLILGLVGIALTLRLAYFSGYGLGDDPIFRNDIATVLRGNPPGSLQNNYRFMWWLPTAVTCRLFGFNEVGLTFPITAFACLGIALAYVQGKALWGLAGGLIAASLLVVHPIDFAWSTMIAPDIILSSTSAAAVFFFLYAIDTDDPRWRRRAWMLSALSLWLAFHSKLSALFLGPVFVLIGLREWRRLDRSALLFVGTAAVLFGLSVAWFYALSGDPLAPYHGELIAQGLVGPEALEWHRATPAALRVYPDHLFLRDFYGGFLNSWYPHALVLFAVVGSAVGLRTSLAMAFWLVMVFLAMELNFQRVEGGWVAGFRNIRHGHVLAHPLILCLTGYLCSLRLRFPLATAVLVVALLGFSLWQSIVVAQRTSVAFADERQVARVLVGLPRKEVISDFQLGHWIASLEAKPPVPYRVASDAVEVRRADFANLRSAYVVTGGGREPYYGCLHCIPRAEELDPARWRLLLEIPGPITQWRSENLRLWETP